MRHVDDPHDPEHQREAESRQRQHEGGDGAFHQGEEEVRAEAHVAKLEAFSHRESPFPPWGEGRDGG